MVLLFLIAMVRDKWSLLAMAFRKKELMSESLSVVDILNQYGFATLAAIAMGYFIYFIYRFTTENLKKKLGEANTALIGLLDRIRMLDNDLIRLRSKLNTVLEIQENERRNDKSKESKRISKTPKE